MKIQFVDLQRQNKIHKKEFLSAITDVVLEADFILGKRVEKFEKKFAEFCNKKYCVSLNSGTDALKLLLLAYGISSGDEVITQANSYFSSAMVVADIGARPVLVDVDEENQIDINLLQKSISKKTKAIIPVHLFGRAARMDEIINIAKENKIIVIEDACQAHGALYKSKIVPYGESGAFSFYPGKNLGCFGDGGAVVTDNKKIYERCLYLRNDGSYEKYIHKYIGIKSRLDSIQAEILSIKLSYLKKWNMDRIKAAGIYCKYLKEISQISVQRFIDNGESVYHLFTIETAKRDELRDFLKKHGIDTVIHYPIPIHLQVGFKDFGYKKGDFPVSERKSKEILSLPLFPEIRLEEIKYVCKKIEAFFKKK